MQTNDNIWYNVVDFPGNYQFKNDLQKHISQCGALIYVIDAQSQEYDVACAKLNDLIMQTSKVKPNLNYEVFIHKIDGDFFNTDEAKLEAMNTIKSLVDGYLEKQTNVEG